MTIGPQRGGQRFSTGQVAIGQRHPHALGAQPLRGGSTDAACGARDDRDLSLQFEVHGVLCAG